MLLFQITRFIPTHINYLCVSYYRYNHSNFNNGNDYQREIDTIKQVVVTNIYKPKLIDSL